MATPAQIEANRRNARKSTGPKTAAGKAASSRNALTHGMTASIADADVRAFYEIIREMMDAGVAPRIDPEGNQFVYEILYKKNNLRIGEDKTLHDAGVKEGDIIYLAPKIHAGARS